MRGRCSSHSCCYAYVCCSRISFAMDWFAQSMHCIVLLLLTRIPYSLSFIIILGPTSTKPQAEILKLNNVNGCNDISFGDHSILEGDRIPPLKSHALHRRWKRNSVSLVSSVTTVMRRQTVPGFQTRCACSCRRNTALQGALVLAKSGRLELGDNILRTL